MRTLALLALLPPAAVRGDGSRAIVLRLQGRAVVTARTVKVADVADLSGGPALLREQVGRLDLARMPTGGALTVTRRQLSFRLQLAGIPASLFRVEGAEDSQVVARFRPVTPDEVVAAARKALLATLPWSADEVQIDLVQPVTVALPAVADDEALIVKATPHQGQRPPGRVQMDVRLFVQGTNRLSLAVYFEVRPCVEVAVCRQRIDKGQELSASNVYYEKRPVDQGSRLAIAPATLRSGKMRVRRALLPGQIVQSADVEGAEGEANPVLVKAQQAVKIQIHVGKLKVTATGLALQEGRRGQVIRVQNSDSKKVLPGRVIGPALVEVE